MKDDKNGWSDVPALMEWTCPECKKKSFVDAWKETWVECECCGDHDARECPNCESVFDSVWGAEKIAAASKNSQ